MFEEEKTDMSYFLYFLESQSLGFFITIFLDVYQRISEIQFWNDSGVPKWSINLDAYKPGQFVSHSFCIKGGNFGDSRPEVETWKC